MFSRKNSTKLQRQFSYGAKPDSIPPNLTLAPWKSKVVSAYTGPNTGLTRLEVDAVTPLDKPEEIAGVTNWNNPSEYAYGISLSLYEENKPKSDSSTTRLIGDPIADVFAVVVRENNAIIAVADGSGWGRKPRLAARCAVNAAVTYISENIDKLSVKKPSSSTLSKLLYDTMDVAQHTILQQGGTLTTLSVAVACQMDSHKSEEWGLFVASLGDSPVCVYCPHTQSILDVTVGCHDKSGTRNVQLSGGALGPAIGTLPDLENLTLAYSPVYPDDIVILMTDGIMDNFAPKVLQGLEKEKRHLLKQNEDADSGISHSPQSCSPNSSPILPRTPSPQTRHKQLKLLPVRQPSPLLTRLSSTTSRCKSVSPTMSPHLNEASWLWGESLSSSCASISPLVQHRSLRIDSPLIDDDTSSTTSSESVYQVMNLMECCEPMHELGQFLKRHQNELLFDHLSAQTVASATINTVVEATESKRRFRTECLEKGMDINRLKKTDPEFAKQVEQYYGKLDHATIVTYSIGIHH